MCVVRVLDYCIPIDKSIYTFRTKMPSNSVVCVLLSVRLAHLAVFSISRATDIHTKWLGLFNEITQQIRLRNRRFDLGLLDSRFDLH